MKRSVVNLSQGGTYMRSTIRLIKNKKSTDETERGKFSHKEELICEVPSG